METPDSKDKPIPKMPPAPREYNIGLTRKVLLGFFIIGFWVFFYWFR